MPKVKYSQEQRLYVADLRKGGKSLSEISNETGIPSSSVYKMIRKINMPKKVKNKVEKTPKHLELINWTSFEQCPECKGKRVNDVRRTASQTGKNPNVFCVDCGTEWMKRNKNTYKLLWHMMD